MKLALQLIHTLNMWWIVQHAKKNYLCSFLMYLDEPNCRRVSNKFHDIKQITFDKLFKGPIIGECSITHLKCYWD